MHSAQDDRLEFRLLEEYRALVERMTADDSHRQQRIQTLLTVNTILLAALAAIISSQEQLVGSSGTDSGNLLVAIVLLAVFGVVFCLMWWRILLRHGEHIRLRLMQLRETESQLGGLTTFRNVSAGMSGEPVNFPNIAATFVLKRRAKVQSGAMETQSPLVLAVFWFVVIIIAVLSRLV